MRNERTCGRIATGMKTICNAAIIRFAAAGLWAAEGLVQFGGVVSAMRDTDDYFFMRSEAGEDWRVSMDGKPKIRLAPGDLVEVEGVLEKPANRHTRRLFAAEARKTGHDDFAVPQPERMTIAGLWAKPEGGRLVPDWYARMVEVEGRVHDFWRRDKTTTIVIADKDRYVHCQVAAPIACALPQHFGVGARVNITGIAVYSAAWGEGHVLTGFDNVNLLVQGMDEVEVLTRPPWWTEERIWTAAGLGAFAIAMLSIWVVLLLRARRAERANERMLAQDRRRIADDLHDNMQQLLAGVAFRLTAAQFAQGVPESVRAQIASAQKALEHAQAGLRSVLWGLQEVARDASAPERLLELYKYAASRMPHWEGVVEIRAEGAERPEARKIGARLLMIMQEAVGNALSHGGARHVDVLLTFGKSNLAMTVRDDGCGFDAGGAGKTGSGLASMRRRAEEIGGVFRVESELGKGTTVKVEVSDGQEENRNRG